MCMGSKTASTVAAADPVVQNVATNEATASASRSAANKQRNKRGSASNSLRADTMLGAAEDTTVRNTLG